MPLFNTSALKPGVSPKEVFAWVLFDAANSGYSTVVLTAVFNTYFVSTVCSEASWGTFLWSCAVGAANVLSIFLMPAVGRIADMTASKKKWLIAATLLCVVATCGLALSGPGTYVLSVAMLIVSYVGYNVGESLNSAFLPEISRPEAVGKVSGWGWSLGYIGGLVTLAICLAVVLAGQKAEASMDKLVAATNIITAAVFLVVATPVFIWLKERSEPQGSAGSLRECLRFNSDFAQSLVILKNHRDFAVLVVCGFFYQAGVATVITLAAVYASAVMGFGLTETLIMVLLVNITAAIGAFAFGYVQDKIGHKMALAVTLLLWIAMVVAASTQTRAMFWVAANLAGLAMGSSQSAGRALVAVLAPKEKLARFYGIWNMALWLSAVAGPVTYGAVTWITGNNQRLAIFVTGLFFVVGLISLLPVNVARGRMLAYEEETHADQTIRGLRNA